MNTAEQLKALSDLLQSDADNYALLQRIAACARSIERNEMFDWMLNSLTTRNHTCSRGDVLLSLLPCFTSKDDEETLLNELKKCLKRKNSNVSLTSILHMLERAQGRFHPLSVVLFLYWCLQSNRSICNTIQFIEVILSYIVELRDEQEIIKGIQTLRSACNEVNIVAQPMASRLQHDAHIRTAYRNLLLVTKTKDYTILDVIAFLTLSHSFTEEGDIREHFHHDTFSVITSTMQKLDTTSSIAQTIILPAMMELGLYMVLSPIRRPEYPPLDLVPEGVILPIQAIMMETKQYVVDLFHILPLEQRQDLITMLLSLAEIQVDFDLKEERCSLKEAMLERLPANLRRILKGVVTDKRIKVEFRNWHDVFTSSTTMVISIIRHHRTLFGTDIIRHRLERFARQLWNEDNEESEYVGQMKDCGCAMIELYCVAFVEYMELANTNDDISKRIDGIGMVQRLLLSFWDVKVSNRASMIGRDGSVVLGVILARYLIQSSFLSTSDREIILEWVSRILLSEDNDGCICVDAVTGYWGVVFLCSLCPELDGYPMLTRKSTLLRQSFRQKLLICPLVDIFDRIKIIVIARLGLIQLESTVENKDARIVFGYTKVPGYFEAKKAKTRRTFCAASLLKRLNTKGLLFSSQREGITEWLRFINCLVDIYFKIARELSANKWNPDGWLLASMELFPSVNNREIELLQNYAFSDDMEAAALPQQIDSTGDEGTSIISLLQCSSAYAIAIVICSAVLKNAHSNYQMDAKSGKETAVMKLIQFQLAKLYDLHYRLHSMLNLIQQYDKRDIQILVSTKRNYTNDTGLLIPGHV